MRFTKAASFFRAVVTCLVMCVFFVQSTLVVSAHQSQMHSTTALVKLVAGSLQNCKSDLTKSGSHSGSHIHQSDCCQFCQSSLNEFSYLDVLGLAQIIAILTPSKLQSSYVPRYERAVVGSELNGFKSTWSAQAPPKA